MLILWFLIALAIFFLLFIYVGNNYTQQNNNWEGYENIKFKKRDNIDENDFKTKMAFIKKKLAIFEWTLNFCNSDFKYDETSLPKRIIKNKLETIDRNTWIDNNDNQLNSWHHKSDETNYRNDICYNQDTLNCKWGSEYKNTTWLFGN